MRKRTLNSILDLTGNQCREAKIRVIQSLKFLLVSIGSSILEVLQTH